MAVDLGKDLIVRWTEPDVSHLRLLRQAGVQGVVIAQPHEQFEKACREARISIVHESDLHAVKPDSLPSSPTPAAILEAGLWPGISRGSATGQDEDLASASTDPWVDSNAYWIAWLKALCPRSAPVLAYRANEAAGLRADRVVPLDSLELALAETRIMGGNTILSLDPHFRTALLNNEAKALKAWAQFGATAAWLASNRNLFGAPILPTATALVESGDETAELANMMFRRNASPQLIDAAAPPAPSRDILVLVATGLRPLPPPIAARVFAHAQQGAIVVTDWWHPTAGKIVKKQEDRVFYAAGRGAIVAYNEKVVDPSEHALDVIDLVTHPRRAVRIWNAPALIGIASRSTLQLLNYGSPTDGQTQVRFQGHYSRARLLRPEAAPVNLETARRGSTTEIFLPEVRRVATVIFS